jgi:hypothetical protein
VPTAVLTWARVALSKVNVDWLRVPDVEAVGRPALSHAVSVVVDVVVWPSFCVVVETVCTRRRCAS